ncbi:apolipoprotein N-acyltransferase [Pseudomaricurvus sp. HS19]|uniref:apolipoprotein N-acyltransferase n=1 Tax=Pseudomaricurvus sp. HS19 TaxID=2692626 RepID=UPI00136CF1F5|nr:apolipoprotein N-acyltransferase [Pseudomaricurvus sp. HS19]MYM64659.1 apolipoprotein N-acyltransferase [Pseudomaricurvus sp. HS19]
MLPSIPARLRALSLRSAVLLALLPGALAPLALAPLNLWPLALLCPPLLALLTWQRTAREAFLINLAFGVAFFTCGASWVFVSIYTYGNAPLPLALLLTGLFTGFLGLVFALWQTPANLRCLGSHARSSLAAHLLCFSAIWVVGEWLRGWVLTGFPWLYLGYSQLQTPLLGFAPAGGVLSVSLATLLSGSALLLMLLGSSRVRLASAASLALLWSGGWLLQNQSWSAPSGDSVTVALVQGNIPQEKKWSPDFLIPTLDRYQQLSALAPQADWVIWPEAAIPLLYHEAGDILMHQHQQSLANEQAFITGILYDDRARQQYFNSITGLGLATGIYHKTRLVPFGEYVPLENWLRGLIDFFNLPRSMITAGREEQAGLQIGRLRLASAICYEIVYPGLVARMSRDRDMILTISNDAWFGSSWGPLQHLQMAQMRAVETGRYVLRATNNGVSAVIAPDGTLLQQSGQFVATVLQGEARPMLGNTPYMRFQDYPLLLLLVIVLAGLAIRPRH